MRQPFTLPLLAALVLTLSVPVCRGAGPPARLADPAAGGPVRDWQPSIQAPEEERARRWRDVVMPQLEQLHRAQAVSEYVRTVDLDALRRTLAQARMAQEGEAARPGLQGSRERVELTLQTSVEIALRHNLGLRIAELSKDAAQTDVRRATAIFHPTVGLALVGSGETSVTEGKPEDETNAQSLQGFIRTTIPTGATVALTSDLMRDETRNATSAREFRSAVTLSVVQPLLRGGRVFVATRPIRDAGFDLRVEEARLGAEILRVTAAAKTAYYTALLAGKVIDVTESALERDRTLIEASQALFKAGLVTQRDVSSAELIRAKDAARLASARADLQSAREALLDLLGLSIASDVSLLDKEIRFQPVRFDVEGWIAAAIGNRPEIREIEERLARSALNIRVARNALLPALDFVASYGRGQTGPTFARGLEFGGQAWSAGLVFSIPLGNVAAEAALARADLEHARLEQELAQRKRQIELEVRGPVIKLRKSLDRMDALTVAAEQARGKLDVAKTRFALGLATNLDITDAQEDLLNAETDLLKALVDYNIGLAELEARVGGAFFQF